MGTAFGIMVCGTASCLGSGLETVAVLVVFGDNCPGLAEIPPFRPAAQSIFNAAHASFTEFPRERVEPLFIASPLLLNIANLLSFLAYPLPPSCSRITM